MQPLHLAAQLGNKKAMKCLCQAGADIQAGQTFNEMSGLTALHLSAAEGHAGTVRLLIKAGADIDRQTSSGITALQLAQENGHRDIVRYIKQKALQPVGDR